MMQPMTTEHVVIVVADGVETLDAVGPHDVLSCANAVLGRAAYGIRLAALVGPTVRSSTGLVLGVDVALGDVDRLDTLMVAGGSGMRGAVEDPSMVAEIRRLANGGTGHLGVHRGCAAGRGGCAGWSSGNHPLGLHRLDGCPVARCHRRTRSDLRA